jgi:hypothetical protein
MGRAANLSLLRSNASLLTPLAPIRESVLTMALSVHMLYDLFF